MDLNLTGRVYIVTGASAGIGEATVQLLATEGAAVVGIARNPAGIEALGPRISAVAADLTAPSGTPPSSSTSTPQCG